MPIPIIETCRKRKRAPKLYSFTTFGNPGCPTSLNASFRSNIRSFLHECAELEDYEVGGMQIWCTLLVTDNKNYALPLYTIEEDVKNSSKPFCDHCRCTGWGHNFVSKRKYHVIIPSDRRWSKRLEDGVFDLQTHLLHGLIHCNGFGHLLCINGIEGGSRHLCGRQIMDLWDRICQFLHARKISVEDVSKKRSMDLRLLYGVAYGHPWFGRWGYRFCRGSFGVTEGNYNRAIEILSSLGLDKIIQDFSDTHQMQQIIGYYRDMSETCLMTFRDLLRFMLTVKSRSPPKQMASKPLIRVVLQKKKTPTKEKHEKYRKFSSVVGTLDSRWPARRLEYAAEVIVDALKEKYSQGGMTRQDVRDAARMHIGDTGLLDYVLKSMNNVIVGSYVVSREVNPRTKILEYSIHEFGVELSPVKVKETVPDPEAVDVYADVAYLYMNVLLNYPQSDLVELATQAVLDCKHFVKEWPFMDESEQLLSFICQAKPNLIDPGIELTKRLPPGQIIVLPLHATVKELKRAVEIELRDTYCIMESFAATEIEDMEELQDDDLLFGAVESGTEIFLRGNGVDLNTQLRYERGPDNWRVRCECGARDDDGERMVACDVCEVWQHTRCNEIEDSETVPPLFVCAGCCSSLMPSASAPDKVFESSSEFFMIPEATEYGLELVHDSVEMLL